MLKELNQVIDYIEAHLTDDLSLERISEYAGVSDYHFRKIFFYLSGLTLSEYIKNRKLSEASIKKGVSKSFPKLSFIITVKGGIAMDYRIEDKPAFNLVGVSKRVPMQFAGVNQEIVKLAESITDAQKTEMHALQNIEPYEIVNASYEADANFLREEGDLTHLIGVLTTENQVSDRLDKVPVEAGTWAIFPNEGPFPSALQTTMAKIYSEWLPSSDFEVINAPAFSFTKMENKKDYAYSEVWVPVRKR